MPPLPAPPALLTQSCLLGSSPEASESPRWPSAAQGLCRPLPRPGPALLSPVHCRVWGGAGSLPERARARQGGLEGKEMPSHIARPTSWPAPVPQEGCFLPLCFSSRGVGLPASGTRGVQGRSHRHANPIKALCQGGAGSGLPCLRVEASWTLGLGQHHPCARTTTRARPPSLDGSALCGQWLGRLRLRPHGIRRWRVFFKSSYE